MPEYEFAQSCSPRIVTEPLESQWMTVPLDFKETRHGIVMSIEVIVSPSSKYPTELQFVCPESIKDKLLHAGRMELRFTHYPVMTSVGLATKIDQIKIDHHTFQILEHFH